MLNGRTRNDKAKSVDWISRIRNQNNIAWVNHSLSHISEAFFRSKCGNNLGVGV